MLSRSALAHVYDNLKPKRLTCLFVESAASFLYQIVARLPHLEELSIDTEHATPDQVIAAAARPYRGRPFNSAQIGRLSGSPRPVH
jgi:hypothetical protein